MSKLQTFNVNKLEEEAKKYLAEIKHFEITNHDDVIAYNKIRTEINNHKKLIERVRIDTNKANTDLVNKYAKKAIDPLEDERKAIKERIDKGVASLIQVRKDDILSFIIKKIKDGGFNVEVEALEIATNITNDKILDYRTDNWQDLLSLDLIRIEKEYNLIMLMNNAQDVLKHFYDTFDMVTALERTNAVEEEYEPIEARSVVITYKICDKHQRVINTLEALGIEYDIEYKEE